MGPRNQPEYDGLPNVAEINRILTEARRLSAPPGEWLQRPKFLTHGWHASPANPNLLLPLFPGLRRVPKVALRAYQFFNGYTGHAEIYAFPEILMYREKNLFEAPLLDPATVPPKTKSVGVAMGGVEMDGTNQGYLSASLLGRQYAEYGATAGLVNWGRHTVLDGNPLDSRLEASEWIWHKPAPLDWRPNVERRGERLWVEFYSYCDGYDEGIYRHEDSFFPLTNPTPIPRRETIAERRRPERNRGLVIE